MFTEKSSKLVYVNYLYFIRERNKKIQLMVVKKNNLATIWKLLLGQHCIISLFSLFYRFCKRNLPVLCKRKKGNRVFKNSIHGYYSNSFKNEEVQRKSFQNY